MVHAEPRSPITFTPTLPPPAQLREGVVVCERLRLLGPVLHHPWGWESPAVDLARELGETPYHQVYVQVYLYPLLTREAMETALRTGGAKAWVAQAGAALIVMQAVPAPLPTPASAVERARLFAAALDRLHDRSITGVRFEARQARGAGLLLGGQHLGAPGSRSEDVLALWSSLRAAGVEVGDYAPESAADLHDRLRAPPQAAWTLPLGQPPLVGRDGVLDELALGLELPASGVEIVLVTGPSGVGRSRLLAALADRFAGQAGVSVFHVDAAARAPEVGLRLGGAALPSPLGAELVRRLAMVRTGHEQAPVRLGPFADTLRALVDSGHRAAILLDGVESLHAALAAFLTALTAGDPLPGLLVVVAHAGQPPAWLRAHATEVFELGGLGPPDLRALLERALPGHWRDLHEVADRLHEATGGLPIAVWTQLQGWLRAGALRQVDGQWRLAGGDACLGLVPTVLRAWERSPEPAQALVLLAALWARELPVAGLAQLVAEPEAQVSERVAELLGAGLLVSRGEGGVSAPHHGVARVLVDAASVGQRQAAHARLAQWAAAHPAEFGVARRAWHQENATPPGLNPPLARLHLQAAAELTPRWVTERAAWHLRRALARDCAAGVRFEAHQGLAKVAVLHRALDEAVEHWEAAFVDAPSREATATLGADATHALRLRGRPDLGWRIGRDALRRLGRPLAQSGWRRAMALVREGLGWWLNFPADAEAAAAATSRLLIELLLAPPPPHQAMVPEAMLRAMRATQNRVHGTRALVDALQSVAQAPWTSAEHWRAALGRARWITELAPEGAACAHVALLTAVTELGWGDRERGVRLVEQVVAEARSGGEPYPGVLALLAVCRTQRERATAAQLERWLDQAEPLLLRTADPEVRAAFTAFRLWERAERAGSALARRVRAHASGLGAVRHGPAAGHAHAWTSRALLAVGEPALALRHARLSIAHAGHGAMLAEPACEGWIALGRIALAGGDDPEARAALDDAIGALGRRGCATERIRFERELLACGRAWTRGSADAAPRTEALAAEAEAAGWSGVALAAVRLLDARVPGGRARRQRIEALARDLGRCAEPPTPPETGRAPLPVPSPRELRAWLHDLLREAAPALPGGLDVSAEVPPGLWLDVGEARARLLVLTLLQAARDLIDGTGRVRFTATPGAPDAGPDGPDGGGRDWIALRCVASGLRPTPRWPELDALHQITRALGGILSSKNLDFEGEILLWLPAMRELTPGLGTPALRSPGAHPVSPPVSPVSPPARPDVRVVHPVPAVRDGLVRAVVALGLVAECGEPEAGDVDSPDVRLLIGPPELAASAEVPRLVVRPRQDGAPSEAELGWPFTLDELERKLVQNGVLPKA